MNGMYISGTPTSSSIAKEYYNGPGWATQYDLEVLFGPMNAFDQKENLEYFRTSFDHRYPWLQVEFDTCVRIFGIRIVNVQRNA